MLFKSSLLTIPFVILSTNILRVSGACVTVCAHDLRPYSADADFWANICGVHVSDPSVLMATNLEFYDPRFGCDLKAGFSQACCAATNSCGSGTDCTIVIAPPGQQPGPKLADSWEVASPCTVDNPNRVLVNPIVTYSPETTPFQCTSLCQSKGYKYAGVEYGDECYCGTGFAPDGDAAVADCNMPCAGDNNLLCGGSWRMQVYRVPS